jgi:hypothetical protein
MDARQGRLARAKQDRRVDRLIHQGQSMNETADVETRVASYAEKRWQSDIIVDLIKQFGFPYIALNPRAIAGCTTRW